jgi:hypothetical protein
LLTNIRNGDNAKAIALLQRLKEPNETHLGLSVGKSRGRALGTSSAQDVWQALANSQAVKTGLLTDLEDTVLMIEGISVDVVSDVVTNIIRGPLIEFTQSACKQYGIPLTNEVASGPIWDQRASSWTQFYVSLPTVDDEKLLLVPKEIVRQNMDYDVNKYYRHYILEYLREQEIATNSDLVHIVKSGKNKGKPNVYKKDLVEKYGSGKPAVVKLTLANPQILRKYKDDLIKPSPPLSHRTISDVEGTERPDWDKLLNNVLSLPVGKKEAYKYEDAIEALISAMMYPALAHPKPQTMLHEGRKRVDITYSNIGDNGFFKWLSMHYPSAHVFFECKNYGTEIENPELDQIAGRFSPSRGQFGIIVCRQLKDPSRFAKRCKDTALDGRGYIIALEDKDLEQLVTSVQKNLNFFELPMLKSKFDNLIL